MASTRSSARSGRARTRIEETCLEVVIMEGSPQEIEKLTDRLKAVRGVLFAEAVTTSPDLP